MSWMKRRAHTAASPSNVPSNQMYAASQHSNQESGQWHQQDLTSNTWFNQSAQNQPQKQQQAPYQYNPTQPQPTNYWQHQYGANNYAQAQSNPYQQQQIYNQPNPQQNYYPTSRTPHVLNDQYNQPPPQHYNYNKTETQTNNPYSILQQQQQQPQPQQQQQFISPEQQQQHQPQFVSPEQQNPDSWSNWGWGDEDNSNTQASQNANTAAVRADAIADSFNAEELWNWSVDESSSSTSTLNYLKPEHSNAATSLTSLDSFKQDGGSTDHLFPKMGKLADKHNNVLLDNEAGNKNSPSYEPAKAPGVIKLRNSENLTPQWSTESQMSQESSDDILQTSESDKMLSRSSTISQSPISGQDGIGENLLSIPVEVQSSGASIEGQVLGQHYENVEILSNVKQESAGGQNYLLNAASSLKSHTPSPVQTPPLPAQGVKTHTPPPLAKNQTPPLMSSQGSSDDVKNPYKRNTVLSHAAVAKSRALSQNQPPGFPVFTQSVNLETLPDNSEQPDTLLPPNANQVSAKASQQLPDNNEVAPITERNQYLETGQLSDESTNQLLHIENMDALPPPGLRRMVLGQLETSDSNQNVAIDEPPPGLSRMVLGQTESSSSLTNPRDSSGPPVGFPRMVPGESSSPESNSRHQYQIYQDDGRHEEYNSEVEMNQLHGGGGLLPQTRSATIGADTPPTVANPITQSNVNRSETIGSDSILDDVRPVGSSAESRVGALGVDREQRDIVIGANEDGGLHAGENRRDSIEGQDLKELVSGLRDMTVAAGDVGALNNELEQNSRGRSRQESSDSEREIDGTKSPRDHRDRRPRDKDDRREKTRGRYSPDAYRDRRYERRRPRDRRYEDESDYYSDKEKDGGRRVDERKENYEKRYGSSSRSKDKERRKPRDANREGREWRDPRDDRDAGREYDRRERDYHREYDRRDGRSRGDYYAYYDDGYEGQRSRPSSRSDSMHESFRHERDPRRQRPRDRDRDPRRHRDFNPYMQQGVMYDPYNPYYQQYQYYYENLRRTNPQAYLEWYRKYMQQAGLATTAANFNNEDRGSVHSGRSSANDEIKERYMRQNYYSHSSLPQVGSYYRDTHSVSGQYGMDDSSYDRTFDGTESVPLPAKFATPHLKASIASGKLVKVLPNYPLDGQNATVELLNIRNFLSQDDEMEELNSFPGPLIRGTTHKKTVIEYCENKIRNAICSDNITDPSSYILLWELMILLIRQNGVVVGTDIAELLMKDRGHDNIRPASVNSTCSSAVVDANTPSDAGNMQFSEPVNSSTTSILKEEIVTNKFREYLIYGSEKEALEWAMKHGLWGHALFLASRLDKRTYANVMMRFANGLTMNDPLQTLYQLLSGRIPSAVTAVADEKWGDWRPHLAMILSNTTPKPELGRKAITTLADTLMTRGSIYAAQFCYLMAEVGFSRYGAENAKLVLLGSNHQKPFVQFATNEAIHLTEICEYAYSLNDAGFLILELQPYKYLLATRLSDRGLLEKALAYLERVSLAIIQKPSVIQPALIDRVCQLADRLKYYDPVEDTDDSAALEGDLDVSRPDNSWLKELKAIQNDYNMGLISHESVNNLIEASPDYESLQPQQVSCGDQGQVQEMWQHQQQQLDQYQQGSYGQWQTQQVDQEVSADQTQQTHQQNEHQGGFAGHYQDEQEQVYWQQAGQQQWGGAIPAPFQPPLEHQQEQDNSNLQPENNYWNSAQNEGSMLASAPQITMPNQARRQNSVDSDGTSTATEKTPKVSPAKPKPTQNSGKPAASRSGWFGGIFSSFGLRPKNQMKLPDDKNPSIVWDENRKKWVNLDEDGTETSNEVKPPPKMSDMLPKMPQQDHVPGIPEQQPPYAPSQHANNNPNPLAPNHFAYGQGQNQPHFPGQYGAIPANHTGPVNAVGIPGNMPSVGEEAPKSIQPNMFKLQRGRNLKKSYVDVFNPSGKSSENTQGMMQNPALLGTAPSSGNSQVNFFVPAPVNDPNAPVDFLTPASVNTDSNSQATYQAPQ